MSSVGSGGDGGVGWTLDDFVGLVVEVLRSRFCNDVRMREDFADFIRATFNSVETTSRSLCAGSCLVDPFGLRILLTNVACKAANFGLHCRMESSIGGSILTGKLWC